MTEEQEAMVVEKAKELRKMISGFERELRKMCHADRCKDYHKCPRIHLACAKKVETLDLETSILWEAADQIRFISRDLEDFSPKKAKKDQESVQRCVEALDTLCHILYRHSSKYMRSHTIVYECRAKVQRVLNFYNSYLILKEREKYKSLKAGNMKFFDRTVMKS